MSRKTSLISTESINKDKKPDIKKRPKSIDSHDKEFENMINKSLPNWNAVWSFLLQNNNQNNNSNNYSTNSYTKDKIKKKDKATGNSWIRLSNSFLEKDDHESLQRRIQRKIAEIVREEETLVKLYLKAADVARKREEELKNKTNVLMGQIEKDKHLMKIIQNTC